MTSATLSRQKIGELGAQQGIAYENFVRALWLLQLRGTNHRLVFGWDGEDGTLITDDHSIYRQVKSRRNAIWYRSDLEPFLKKAHERFAADSRCRHEFFTNSQLVASFTRGQTMPRNVASEFCPDDAEAFAKSVTFHTSYMTLDADTNRALIFLTIQQMLETELGLPRNSMAISSAEARRIVDALLALEGAVEGRDSVTWADVDAATGFDETVRRARTELFGEGIFRPWSEVRSAPRNVQVERAVRSRAANRRIERAAAASALMDVVDRWAASAESDPAPRFHVIVITGAHGTGKTWLLESVAERLASRPLSVQWTDKPVRDSAPFLNVVARNGKPTVFLIDEILQSGSDAAIGSSVQAAFRHPVLIVATASAAADDADVELLVSRLRTHSFHARLDSHVSRAELGEMAAIRGRDLSGAERKKAARLNLRSAARLVLATENAPDLFEVKKFLDGDREKYEWLQVLLLCTYWDVAVPRSLLERLHGRGTPKWLEPWTVETGPADEPLLYFSDPAQAPALLIRAHGSTREMILTTARRLLETANPEEATERSFIRLVLRTLKRSPDIFPRVTRIAQKSIIAAIVNDGSSVGLVESWLRLLRDTDQAFVEAAVSCIRIPSRIDELTVLARLYSDDDVRNAVRALMASANAEDVPAIVALVGAVAATSPEVQRPMARLMAHFIVTLPVPICNAFFSSARMPFYTMRFIVGTNITGPIRERIVRRITEWILAEWHDSRRFRVSAFSRVLLLIRMALRQKRFAAVRRINAAIAAAEEMPWLMEAYSECRLNDFRLELRKLPLQFGNELLEEHGDDPQVLRLFLLGLLKYAADFADDDECNRLVELWLKIIDEPGIGAFDPGSQELFGGSHAVSRMTPDAIRRLIGIVIQWLPDADTVITLQRARLPFLLLELMGLHTELKGRWPATEVFTSLVLGTEEELAKAYAHFQDGARSLNIDFSGVSAIRVGEEWKKVGPFVPTMLSVGGRLVWRDADRLRAYVQQEWGDNPDVQFRNFQLLLRIGDVDAVRAWFDRKIANGSTFQSDYAALAECDLLQGHVDDAYRRLHDINRLQREGHGGSGLMMRRLHRAFTRYGRPAFRMAHSVAFHLSADGMLAPWERVVSFSQDRAPHAAPEPEELSDDESMETHESADAE